MRYWLNDGSPLEDGRFCFVIDPEDGTRPLKHYGASKEEALEKAAVTAEHAERLITRMRTTPSTPTAAAPAAPAAPAPKQPMSADERMRLTADLGNPAKSAEAAVRLVEDATGMDFKEEARKRAIINFSNLCQSWENSQPDFPKHPINRELVAAKATILAGGSIANVTRQNLETAFRQLLNAGTIILTEEEPSPGESLPTPTPAVRPEETPAPRTVRPRGATSYSRTSLSGTAPVASPRPKYTRAQIDGMTAKEYRHKLETEPGFAQNVAQLKNQSRSNVAATA